MGKIWAVCSGSGGVGKSTLALSLAVGAAKAGKKTILLDASGISRSCDLTLGLESIVVLDMVDVIARQADIQAALYRVPRHDGLRFACASLHEGVPVSEISTIKPALCALWRKPPRGPGADCDLAGQGADERALQRGL